MSTPLARRFERYATALAMISEGVAELEPAEAASLLRSALALVETDPQATARAAAVAEMKRTASSGPRSEDGTTARVLAFVEAQGSTTTPEVAEALGITSGSASFSLRSLTNDRKIVRAKRGTYEAKK